MDGSETELKLFCVTAYFLLLKREHEEMADLNLSDWHDKGAGKKLSAAHFLV